MNTKLYSATLKKALKDSALIDSRPYPKCKPDYLQIVGDLQVELIQSLLQLVATKTFKLAATPRNRDWMIDIAREAIKVLWIVRHRDLTLSGSYSAQALVETVKSDIAETKRLSLAKNSDYSPENIAAAGLVGIFARMSDKVARISHSLRTGRALRVKDEKLADTARDLVNYAIYLSMVLEDGWWVRKSDRVSFQKLLASHGAGEIAGIYQPVGRGSVEIDFNPLDVDGQVH